MYVYQSKYLQFKVYVKVMSIPEDSEAHVHVGINHRSRKFTSVISAEGTYTKMKVRYICTLVDSVATQVYLVENQLHIYHNNTHTKECQTWIL